MVFVPNALRRQIVADCLARRPDEACGFLFGRGGRLERVTAAENVWPVPAERPHRFAIDPLEQMKAESAATGDGLDLLGFYHSHPTAPAIPSRFDLGRAWPAYLYLIVGLSDINCPEFRVWALDAHGAFVEHVVGHSND